MNFNLSFAKELSIVAEKLAVRYQFSLTSAEVIPRLNLGVQGLELITAKFKPLRIDFNAASLQRRALVGKQQGLLKACKPRKHLNIIDVTAGLGRDAFILAGNGADVLMLERNPVLAALLSDALVRFVAPTPNFGSLKLLYIDGLEYLSSIEQVPDLIYIDPMHPMRKKSALVKKDMQVLQNIIGSDLDAKDLLSVAISIGCERVVMKWPQNNVALLKPRYSIPGTTVRFDVY